MTYQRAQEFASLQGDLGQPLAGSSWTLVGRRTGREVMR
jgi:hypothetical protein